MCICVYICELVFLHANYGICVRICVCEGVGVRCVCLRVIVCTLERACACAQAHS